MGFCFCSFRMSRLSNRDILAYLDNLEDSEDGLDGSESEPEDEGNYYRNTRQLLQDLENAEEPDIEPTGTGEVPDTAGAEGEEHLDPPLVMEEPAEETSSTQGTSRNRPRPLGWRKRNMTQVEFTFEGDTTLPDELLNRRTPSEFFHFFFTPELI